MAIVVHHQVDDLPSKVRAERPAPDRTVRVAHMLGLAVPRGQLQDGEHFGEGYEGCGGQRCDLLEDCVIGNDAIRQTSGPAAPE